MVVTQITPSSSNSSLSLTVAYCLILVRSFRTANKHLPQRCPGAQILYVFKLIKFWAFVKCHYNSHVFIMFELCFIWLKKVLSCSLMWFLDTTVDFFFAPTHGTLCVSVFIHRMRQKHQPKCVIHSSAHFKIYFHAELFTNFQGGVAQKISVWVSIYMMRLTNAQIKIHKCVCAVCVVHRNVWMYEWCFRSVLLLLLLLLLH